MQDRTSEKSAVGAATQAPQPLRVLFFSDWRIQPLHLVFDILERIGPVDLILYGGDDVARMGSVGLCRLATYARYGLAGVIGNDCAWEDKLVFKAAGLHDLHDGPLEIDGWGFIGSE